MTKTKGGRRRLAAAQGGSIRLAGVRVETLKGAKSKRNRMKGPGSAPLAAGRPPCVLRGAADREKKRRKKHNNNGEFDPGSG